MSMATPTGGIHPSSPLAHHARLGAITALTLTSSKTLASASSDFTNAFWSSSSASTTTPRPPKPAVVTHAEFITLRQRLAESEAKVKSLESRLSMADSCLLDVVSSLVRRADECLIEGSIVEREFMGLLWAKRLERDSCDVFGEVGSAWVRRREVRRVVKRTWESDDVWDSDVEGGVDDCYGYSDEECDESDPTPAESTSAVASEGLKIPLNDINDGDSNEETLDVDDSIDSDYIYGRVDSAFNGSDDNFPQTSKLRDWDDFSEAESALVPMPEFDENPDWDTGVRPPSRARSFKYFPEDCAWEEADGELHGNGKGLLSGAAALDASADLEIKFDASENPQPAWLLPVEANDVELAGDWNVDELGAPLNLDGHFDIAWNLGSETANVSPSIVLAESSERTDAKDDYGDARDFLDWQDFGDESLQKVSTPAFSATAMDTWDSSSTPTWSALKSILTVIAPPIPAAQRIYRITVSSPPDSCVVQKPRPSSSSRSVPRHSWLKLPKLSDEDRWGDGLVGDVVGMLDNTWKILPKWLIDVKKN